MRKKGPGLATKRDDDHDGVASPWGVDEVAKPWEGLESVVCFGFVDCLTEAFFKLREISERHQTG